MKNIERLWSMFAIVAEQANNPADGVTKCYNKAVECGLEAKENVPQLSQLIEWLAQEHFESVLNHEEKEYLKNLLRPYRGNLEYVEKEADGKRYAHICFKTKQKGAEEQMITRLPNFPVNQQYVDMEMGKKYTLAELGIKYAGEVAL